MKITEKGEVYFGDLSAETIAALYGTPTYVYEEDRIRGNYRRLCRAFQKRYEKCRFFYAIKACSNPAVAHILRQEGAGMDVASANEIRLARSIGVSGEEILFSGNFLSDEDLEVGVREGVIFNLDDVSLLPRLLRFGRPEVISFRLNPGYGASNVGDHDVFAGPKAKFGMFPDALLEAYRMAASAGIRRFGIHTMPGSCVTSPDYFASIAGLLLDVAAKVSRRVGIDFEFADLGGGLGIPYRPGEAELNIEETAEKVVSVFLSKIEEHRLKAPRLIMEPGRYFVGNAGYLLGRVHAVKASETAILGTDIGMNTLARPSLYGAYHHVYIHCREGEPRAKMGLCGQICENTDYWVRERELPLNASVGDLVIVENAGAYGFSMAYSYNGRLRPAEVLVRGGEHFLIRKREDFNDLIRHVQVPDHLLEDSAKVFLEHSE